MEFRETKQEISCFQAGYPGYIIKSNKMTQQSYLLEPTGARRFDDDNEFVIFINRRRLTFVRSSIYFANDKGRRFFFFVANKQSESICFSQCASGRNSSNHAISLIPATGGIFSILSAKLGRFVARPGYENASVDENILLRFRREEIRHF